MVKHRLIFNFYINKDFESNEANKVHFECLKRYSNVFDEAKFVVTLDDVSDDNLIKRFEKKIIDCGFVNNLTFVVRENNEYREAYTFSEDIMTKLKDLDGLTFFGHNKGITNVLNPKFRKDTILQWIFAMYYYNLEFIKEVDRNLVDWFDSMFYGALLTYGKTIENKSHYWYAGSFCWLNTRRIYNNIEQRNIEVLPLHDRGYAEFTPGNIGKDTFELSSHGNKYLFAWDAYKIDFTKIIDFISEDKDESDDFYKKYKGIINSAKIVLPSSENE